MRQYLIHLHTGSANATPETLKLGELAIRHNAEKPELLINVGSEDAPVYKKFIDEGAIDTKLGVLQGDLEGQIGSLEEAIDGKLNNKAGKEEMTNAIASAKAEVYASGVSYTDGVKTALTETINSVKATADAAAVATAVTASLELKADKTQVASDIANAKAEVYASGVSYTDGVKSALTVTIEDIDSRLEVVEGLNTTAVNAIHKIEFNGQEVSVKKDGGLNKAVINIDNLVIDCGTFGE